MVEIVTLTSNSIFTTETSPDESKQALSEAANDFYNMIKPSLNHIIKAPSEQTIQNIMDFSKSM